jgi:hypothetical protein
MYNFLDFFINFISSYARYIYNKDTFLNLNEGLRHYMPTAADTLPKEKKTVGVSITACI